MIRPLARYQLLIDAIIAGAFLALALLFIWMWSGNPGSSTTSGAEVEVAVGIVLTIVYSGALAIRRLSPALALLVCWIAAVTQMLFLLPPIAANFAIFAVIYATAAYGSRLVFWAGFGSSIVGAATISTYLLLPPVSQATDGRTDFSPSLLMTVLFLFLAAAFAFLLSWTVGALVRVGHRARENRQAQEQAEADAAAEQERARIARDMHDVVAHSLAVVIAQADGARYAAAANPGAATEALSTISTTARSALSDVRMLLTQLRHRESEGPQPTLTDLEAVYAQVRAAGADLTIDVDPAPRSTEPAALQLAIYRIIQEALTNALRHGDGAAVTVHQRWLDDEVQLDVRNRISAAPAAPTASRGHGIIGMRERAQLVGGRLSADREANEFVVRAWLPRREDT